MKFVGRQVACRGSNTGQQSFVTFKATMLRDKLQGNVARDTWPLSEKNILGLGVKHDHHDKTSTCNL